MYQTALANLIEAIAAHPRVIDVPLNSPVIEGAKAHAIKGVEIDGVLISAHTSAIGAHVQIGDSWTCVLYGAKAPAGAYLQNMHRAARRALRIVKQDRC